MLNIPICLKCLNSVTITVASVILSWTTFSSPSQAAERLSIRASGGQRAISVADLDYFVSSGEIPRSLRWYAGRMTDEEIAGLREILQRPLEIPPRTVSTFVNDPIGELLLRRLDPLFWGGNEETNFTALRAALVLASYDEEGLTLMNAIRKYPLRDLRLNLDNVLRASDGLESILLDSKTLIAYAIDRDGLTVQPEGILISKVEGLPDPRRVGASDWEVTTISIANSERPPGETVLVDIYLPQDTTEPAPLVIISHGVASSRDTFAYLAESLASQGFASAVLQHPDSDNIRFEQYIAGFAEGLDPYLAIQRPLDITSLLDELERKGASDPDWEGRISTENVGIIGHSLGGYTALASGGARLDFNHMDRACQDFERQILPFNLSLFLQCGPEGIPFGDYQLQDERIGAVLAINPFSSTVFGPDGLGQMQVPTMIVSSSNDFFTPAVKEQVIPFTWLQGDDRYLVMVENATHASFTQSKDPVFELPDVFIGPDPALAQPGMRAIATVFFQTHIAGSDGYAPLLAEPFAVSTDGGEFTYVLTNSLDSTEVENAILQGK